MRTRRELLTLLAGTALAGWSLPTRASSLRLLTRDPGAQEVLSAAASSSTFWEGAQVRNYKEKAYDEVRLKALDTGYLAMVTGEGQRDFKHETVVRTVFENMSRLPQVEDGAKAVVRLGSGTDSRSGLSYADSFYFLDFSFFYGTYGQRMYRLVDGDRTILFFEHLNENVAGAAWPAYQAKMEQVVASVKRRSLLNSVIPVSEIYGMFTVEPGRLHTSRVTFTTRLRFGEGSGTIARLGSEMPMVIRSGLQSGFESCVAIARQLEPA